MLELTAELQARGLMTEGSRRELYKRVQVMHLHQSIDSAIMMQHLFGEWSSSS